METTTRTARIRRRILTIGIPVVTLLCGVGIGTSAAGGVPEPEIHTERVEVPVEVERPVEVEVPVTPAACSAALDSADEVIQLAADGFGVVETMFDAASRFDAAGINAGSAELDRMQPSLAASVSTYREEAAECRAN